MSLGNSSQSDRSDFIKKMGSSNSPPTKAGSGVQGKLDFSELFSAFENEYFTGEKATKLDRQKIQELFSDDRAVNDFIRRINAINDLDRRRFVLNKFILVANQIEYARVKLANSADFIAGVHKSARKAGVLAAAHVVAAKVGWVTSYLDPYTLGLIAIGVEVGAGGIRWYQRNRIAALQFDREKWDQFIDAIEKDVEQRHRVVRLNRV